MEQTLQPMLRRCFVGIREWTVLYIAILLYFLLCLTACCSPQIA